MDEQSVDKHDKDGHRIFQPRNMAWRGTVGARCFPNSSKIVSHFLWFLQQGSGQLYGFMDHDNPARFRSESFGVFVVPRAQLLEFIDIGTYQLDGSERPDKSGGTTAADAQSHITQTSPISAECKAVPWQN
jgi:hypothetical protein